MKSVRVKITLFNIAIVALILVSMGLTLRARLRASLVSQIDRELETELGSVSTRRIGLDPPFKPNSPPSPPLPMQTQSRIVELIHTSDSEVRLQKDSAMPRIIPMPLDGLAKSAIGPADLAGFKAAGAGTRTFRDFKDGGRGMRSLSVPIVEKGRVVAVAQSVRPLTGIDAQVVELDRVLWAMIPAAILVAAVTGGVLLAGTMRPLRRLTSSARRLETDLSGNRLPVNGRDEFAELALAFNEAFDRTSTAFESQRRAIVQLERFTGDAGHELRTPLGSIKSSSTYMLHLAELPEDSRKAVEIIDRSADRMAKLIDDLVLLARQDSGQVTSTQTWLDLATVVDEALEPLDVPGHLTLRLEFEEGLRVCADYDSLVRVVRNLVSNALAYARSSVVVTADRSGKIAVIDDGEGIASEHLSRLGERFYRPDAARTRRDGGTGLGLAIAKSLCEGQGAKLEIRSVPGVGTTVTVLLGGLPV